VSSACITGKTLPAVPVLLVKKAQDTDQEEAHGMRRNHLKIRKIRLWLALAVAIASLGLPSSAFAKYSLDASGPSVTPQSPVVVPTSGGFAWGDALVGAGVAFGVAVLGGIGIAYVARSRTRLLA